MSETQPYAVIDIGSNSVRLVVYRHFSRAPVQSFNEKAMCELGRGVARNGRLDQAAVDKTMLTLDRFKSLAAAMGAAKIDAFATAAVRDADNGNDFLERANAVLDQDVTLLAGEDEARTAVAGVLCGINDPDGLVADLGGGSLEVGTVRSGVTGTVASLDVGVLSLSERSGGEIETAAKIADKALLTQHWVNDACNNRPIYAVGGSWRAIARAHMRAVGWPLRVAHQYRIESHDCLDFTRWIIDQARHPGFELEGAPRKRQATVAFAAATLSALIDRAKSSCVIFSATGVREGRLYLALDERDRGKDPLVHAARGWGRNHNREQTLGPALVNFTDRIHGTESKAMQRLRVAACHVSDIAWRDHPDNRGHLSFSRLVQFPFVAIDHFERVALALAIHYRYGGVSSTKEAVPLINILPPRLRLWAEIQGRAMQLAYRFSGGVADSIRRASLTNQDGCLQLTLPRDHAVANGDTVERRMSALQTILGAKAWRIDQPEN